MAETKTYSGSCHCGRVSYEADADLSQVIACNCSICRKRGLLLTFMPGDKFKLVAGEDALVDYLFKTRTIHHLFCKTCGVESFARGATSDGTPVIAVNVRCLDGVDIDTLSPNPVDGKSF